MRVALCLSGQPRFVRECYDGIKQHLIDPNNPDIFIHTWSYEHDNDSPYKFGGNGGWKHKRISADAHVEALDLYRPVSHRVELSKKFSLPSVSLKRALDLYSPGTELEAQEAGISHEDYMRFMLSNGLSMWHSIFSSHQLMYEHSLINGFEYDAVIRCRFDVACGKRLDMSAYDQNFLYSCEMGKKWGHIADWLNFSKQENMMVYASTFVHYKKIYSEIQEHNMNPICNEMALAVNLARNGVKCANIDMSLSLPRF